MASERRKLSNDWSKHHKAKPLSGPDHVETRAAIASVDAAIARTGAGVRRDVLLVRRAELVAELARLDAPAKPSPFAKREWASQCVRPVRPAPPPSKGPNRKQLKKLRAMGLGRELRAAGY